MLNMISLPPKIGLSPSPKISIKHLIRAFCSVDAPHCACPLRAPSKLLCITRQFCGYCSRNSSLKCFCCC